MDEQHLAHKIRDSLRNRYNAYSLDATNETYAAVSYPVGMDRSPTGDYAVSFYIRTSDSEGYEVSVRKIGLWEPDHNGR